MKHMRTLSFILILCIAISPSVTARELKPQTITENELVYLAQSQGKSATVNEIRAGKASDSALLGIAAVFVLAAFVAGIVSAANPP